MAEPAEGEGETAGLLAAMELEAPVHLESAHEASVLGTRLRAVREVRSSSLLNHHRKENIFLKGKGTSLVVQCLRRCSPNAGNPGWIPGQGTRPHKLQRKITLASTKTHACVLSCCSRV